MQVDLSYDEIEFITDVIGSFSVSELVHVEYSFVKDLCSRLRSVIEVE